MSAKLVLNYYLEKYKTMANTVTDISFDNLSFLTSREPKMNMKGEKVSKSYYDLKGREAIKIVYNKIIETYNYNGVDYPNIFIGLSKSIQFIDWSGAVGWEKRKQPYYFELEPVYIGDGTTTIVGFSSPKQRKVLKNERYAADDFLQSKNPALYAMLYGNYTTEYESYLRTGDKTNFVDAINNESSTAINGVFDQLVQGTQITIKQLIIMNLQ